MNVGFGDTAHVKLNGSASVDPDGNLLSYVWFENQIEIASGMSPNLNLEVGLHNIELIVTDDDGAVHSDSVSVLVNNSPATSETITAQVASSTDDMNEDSIDAQFGLRILPQTIF